MKDVKNMEDFGALIGLIAIVGIIAAVIDVIISLAVIVGAVIILCMSIKEKNKLKSNDINEEGIKKITTLAIVSLVISVLNCAVPSIVLSILGLVFATSNAKKLLLEGNIIEAVKKADVSLIMLIISNIYILAMIVLNIILNVLKAGVDIISELG